MGIKLARSEPDDPQVRRAFRVLAKNRHVERDWNELLRVRGEMCLRCWDHISTAPTQRIGKRYLPLRGSQSEVEFEGQRLRQWQYEIDRGARVKVGVGRDFVVVVLVSTGHPKENE